jgi:AraC-like DNA-binding protein
MRATTPEAMALDPAGHYLAGESYAHFCAAPHFWGVLLWGRPGGDDIATLGRALLLELGPSAAPHVSLVDARRIAGVDASAFAALQGYVERNRPALGDRVTHLAIVRPKGMEGAVVAGFFEVLKPPYPVEVFATPAQALAWLDDACAAAPPPSSFEEALEAIHRGASATPTVVTQLRALLSERLDGIALADAARHMGVSDRTLQRRLGAVGTTFQDELMLARMRAAERLLLDTDAPLTTIALDVGCASLQHFSATFRKHAGMSPSAWRKKRQRRGS